VPPAANGDYSTIFYKMCGLWSSSARRYWAAVSNPTIRASACVVKRGTKMVCKSAALGVSVIYNEPWVGLQGCAFEMPKKYTIVRDKIPLPSGGFVEAFRMAVTDLSCFGDGRRLDLTGYSHESEEAAMLTDWRALGADFRAAATKVQLWVKKQGDQESGGGDDAENSDARRKE